MFARQLNLLRAAQQFRALSSINPKLEPILQFAKGSPERAAVDEAVKKQWGHVEEIPCVIGGKEVFTGQTYSEVAPFDHGHAVDTVHLADKKIIDEAIQAALQARRSWEAVPLEERVQIFLKAADLISGKYRADLLAAAMITQGKTVLQAEIDIICELADFYRMHAKFALDMLQKIQPDSTDVVKNSLEFRGMEGFIAAVAPFNFTAIGGNLAGTPALMGNVVLWKPSFSNTLPNYKIFKILQEAGVPDGVLNFVPCRGPTLGDAIISSPDLACVNFTGSSATFQTMWREIGHNVHIYKTWPKLIGECGGKNYHLVSPSAHVPTAVNNTIRSAFEFGGQKCSACSRMYVAESLWPSVKEGLVEACKQMKVDSPLDHSAFFSAVINKKAFDKITEYIDNANKSSTVKTVTGGKYDGSKGYFIEPTIYECSDPHDKLMEEEIFGPVVGAYIYPDNKYEEVLRLISETSPYALTGSVFAQDEKVIEQTHSALKDTAGNFYINDKSTGAVVNQQPFGGARLSGTNDKAGSPLYVLRFVSPQSIKQNTQPLESWRYPYME